MASHRRPKPASRARISIMTAAAATAVALSSQAGAHADPKPTKDEVKTQVDQLNTQAEAATEKFNGATEKEQILQKQVSSLQDQVARQQDQVSTIQGSLGEIAAEQYRNGGISPTVQLMLSSTPDSFLTQAGSLSQLGTSQADALKLLKAEQLKLDQQKGEAESKLAELDATTKTLQADKEDVQAKLAKAQALLDTLTQEEKDALAAADARGSSSSTASRGSSRTDLGNLPPASGYAGVAVRAAMNQQGVPYGWGATGPDAFDCSGLMQWAYAQAGVSLPRTSQEQASVGTGVSLSNAQPGDLVIYGSDAHHVGMYIGNNTVVHAPHTGSVVQTMPADAMPILTIRRV